MTPNIRNQSKRIAMLIDGDNAQASLIEKMLVETTKYGVASVRRIYGDWTEANMSSWKKVLHSHAIQPIQQFRYTVGKNVTDSALIIDAMDLLHSRRVDSFCIVSSDSDYTRLATRIREEGMFVIGMGTKSTPNPFVVACDVFVQVENLTDSIPEEPVSTTPNKSKAPNKKTPDHPEPLPCYLKPLMSRCRKTGMQHLPKWGTCFAKFDLILIRVPMDLDNLDCYFAPCPRSSNLTKPGIRLVVSTSTSAIPSTCCRLVIVRDRVATNGAGHGSTGRVPIQNVTNTPTAELHSGSIAPRDGATALCVALFHLRTS
jgi:uncharacterized LabA/DUF88 family protein